MLDVGAGGQATRLDSTASGTPPISAVSATSGTSAVSATSGTSATSAVSTVSTAVVAVVIALVVTACSGPKAETSSTPAPAKIGDCFAEGSAKPVDCGQHHMAQTVFVSDQAPPQSAAALAPCREAQAKFLGQDFNTRFDVQLWVPDDESWFRCDVVLRNSTQAGAGYQMLTGSMRNVLRNGVSVKLQACLDEKYDASKDQTYTPCDKPHVSQELFVAPAIGTPDEKFPGDVSRRATQACNATAAAADQLRDGHRVAAYYPENSDAWSTGERSADCWLTAQRGRLAGVEADQR